jgi:hypothetical protein
MPVSFFYQFKNLKKYVTIDQLSDRSKTSGGQNNSVAEYKYYNVDNSTTNSMLVRNCNLRSLVLLKNGLFSHLGQERVEDIEGILVTMRDSTSRPSTTAE